MDRTFKITLLYDLYKYTLTEKQGAAIEMYHFENLSITEISEILKISRAAVHDILKRTEQYLETIESKVKYLDYQMTLHKKTKEIKEILDDITLENKNSVEKIQGILDEISPFEI